jgi:cell wall-associated NlpC family hydrolase
MKRAQPEGLSRRRVVQLLSEVKAHRSAGERIDFYSRRFLGQPYKINPLIGSAGTPEVFTAALDGFDCVTYVETVLALARASSVDEFIDELRHLRYENGRVDWRRRNHYMTGWIRNGARHGAVRRVRFPTHVVSKERVLNVVPGLPAKRVRFVCTPKSVVKQARASLKTGDLIFFASTRRRLDVFHCGILVRDGPDLRMRHASRSRKGVVEQDLGEFLKNNRMAGVLIVRPTEEKTS